MLDSICMTSIVQAAAYIQHVWLMEIPAMAAQAKPPSHGGRVISLQALADDETVTTEESIVQGTTSAPAVDTLSLKYQELRIGSSQADAAEGPSPSQAMPHADSERRLAGAGYSCKAPVTLPCSRSLQHNKPLRIF